MNAGSVVRGLTDQGVLTVRRASIIMMTTTRLVHGAAPALTDQGVLIRPKEYTSINDLAASALVTI